VPLSLYASQLALNLAWQPLFFKAKNFKWALTDITGGWVWEGGGD
jgi:tryptophan-rich sensory protein